MSVSNSYFAVSFTPTPTNHNLAESTISCLQLLNCDLDLRDFVKLVLQIEQVQNSKLTQWKNKFTTKFFTELKTVFKSYKNTKKTKQMYVTILSLSNFGAYVSLYDTWRNLLSQVLEDDVLNFVTTFYEHGSSTHFNIVAPSTEIEHEIASIREHQTYSVKLEFARSVLALQETGVKSQDMISYVQDSYKINPIKSLLPTIEPDISTLKLEPSRSDKFNQLATKMKFDKNTEELVERLKNLYISDVDEDSLPITEKALETTLELIQKIGNSKIPLPEIDPSNIGGIDLDWIANNESQGSVCVSSAGTIVARIMKSDSRGNVDEMIKFLTQKFLQ